MKKLRYYAAWILVRPYRWFFWKCITHGSFSRYCGVRWLPERREEWDNYHYNKNRPRKEWEMIIWPDFVWVFLYLTMFKFFRWLNYDAWRPLCRWGEHCRETYPWHARLIHRIGATTAGGAICLYECYHCASKDGWSGDLTEDETGTTFRLERNYTSATPDGTDYRFCGTTICPKCGYESYIDEGSL